MGSQRDTCWPASQLVSSSKASCLGLMVGTVEFPDWRAMTGWMILFPVYTIGIASVVVAILALIPATLLIIIVELRAIRSRAFYMGFGVVVSLPSQLGFFYEMDFFRHPSAVLLICSLTARRIACRAHVLEVRGATGWRRVRG